jgi:hypothetical protein
MKIFAVMIASPNPKPKDKPAHARELALSASSESDERTSDHERSFVQTAVMVKARKGRLPSGRNQRSRFAFARLALPAAPEGFQSSSPKFSINPASKPTK